MFAYAPSHAISHAMTLEEAQFGATDGPTAASGTSASGVVRLRDLSVGSARYEFLKPLSARHSWDGDAWICWALEPGLPYKGRGETPALARQEWACLLHADFQRLYAMRPFEMSEADLRRWQSLLRIIDVSQYRESTPVSLREIGQVRWDTRPYPYKIQWIDGRYDLIELNLVPPELAGCKPGQWVEADVRRHPRTGCLVQIDHVQRIATIREPSEKQLDQYWQDLPKAETEECDWDWPADRS